MPKDKVYTLSGLDSRNNPVEVKGYRCHRCNNLVPDVGKCSDCGEKYVHIDTTDNFKTGMTHFIYECACPEDKRKAQKIIKIEKVFESGVAGRPSAKELIQNFM